MHPTQLKHRTLKNLKRLNFAHIYNVVFEKTPGDDYSLYFFLYFILHFLRFVFVFVFLVAFIFFINMLYQDIL